MSFLIDTGAQLSVVPPSPNFTKTNSSVTLRAANGTNIKTFEPVKHSTAHRIRTTEQPVYSKPRRLAPGKYKIARTEFQHMLDLGIIRPSSSPYASPLHMVTKAQQGAWRPCGDYRRLNSQTVPDKYPVPNLTDFAVTLQGASVFTKLDLRKAFHQLPVADEDIPKTAITTPFGLFEFLRMPFGLCNAAQSFQRLIDETNHGRSTFSTDRLKPACIERDGSTNRPTSPSLDSPQLSSTASTRTASGRTVHWSKKFRTFITH
ncbi:Retrovirus-related Pol polyprotein from transposon opus [Acanthosepion pharaonis]|uniref:Retrovirus-related Pol polyprotein from transposon opus n=1 Tax=Acanthosepion pharaonis TaxID=158019 RepID=A0A812D9B6_ACAPH|nr:Retrovirus-related Pol polyprotein from transposon opus [Sepia pharaonis]